MTYEEGVLKLSGPASATVPANSETEIQIVVRGELRQSAGSHQVTITHQVTEANGAPVSAITNQESINMAVVIKQYSRLRVMASESLVTIGIGDEIDVEFLVYNDGNDKDRFNLDIQTIDDLEGHGWSVVSPIKSVEIDSMAPPAKVIITLIAPSHVSSDNHTVLGNGSHQQAFILEFKATSEYSLRVEGIANYEIADTRIHLIEEKDSLIPRSLAYPNMMFAVFAMISAAFFINSSRINPQSPTVVTPNLHRWVAGGRLVPRANHEHRSTTQTGSRHDREDLRERRSG